MKKKILKPTRTPAPKKPVTVMVAVRMLPKELEMVHTMAKQCTKGNVSELIRQAVLGFKP